MSQIKRDLQIRGESVQRAYAYFKNNSFIVNRKYQRKLVWGIEEKQSFIDSLLHGYPVPLFLFAESQYRGVDVFEIIDGMQRLNAICSFIDQEFDVRGEYFDLETIPETKALKDCEYLKQKTPIVNRAECVEFASYPLPFSTYKQNQESRIDEVFRRINSGGRKLSRQDIRASATLNNFSSVVRLIAEKIRGDVSANEKLTLSQMKKISISNQKIDYGIVIDDIFWVQQNIISKEKVRESKDEELIADILGYLLLKEKPYSGIDVLDSYYGLSETSIGGDRHEELERVILRDSPELVVERFIHIFDIIRNFLERNNLVFNRYIGMPRSLNLPRYYQCFFIPFWELIIEQHQEIIDENGLVQALKGSKKNFHIPQGGGGIWTAKDKNKTLSSSKGLISQYFAENTNDDPAIIQWATQFENILTQSSTEQVLYDFKIGFYPLLEEANKAFSVKDQISDYVKTMSAIANVGKAVKGYLILGIADKEKDAIRHNELYGVNPINFRGFNIVGLNSEASKFHKDLDKYFQFIIQSIKNLNCDQEFKDLLMSGIKLIKYYDKDVLIFKILSPGRPVIYDGDYYDRKGTSTSKVLAEDFSSLYNRFQ